MPHLIIIIIIIITMIIIINIKIKKGEFIEFYVSSFLATTISVHDVLARGMRSPFSLKICTVREEIWKKGLFFFGYFLWWIF
jgi:hypothetical protein